MPMNRDDVVIQRWLILGLVASTTLVAAMRLWAILRVDGLSSVEMLLLVMFAVLFAWIAASFWVACLGAHALWRGTTTLPLRENGPADPVVPSRTALVMPIYNENCAQVCARLQAMHDSLREAGVVDGFDFFLLSDSTDPRCCAEEDAAWRRLRRETGNPRIYYRHRARNIGRKSGNIADFCENWGALYEYMVVLDADSLMTGRTLARLVRVMDANPRTALIQVGPLLVGAESLFARSQQFASWVYGRVFAAGLSRLQGADGNYWGHNAIIRVQPFMQHCGLPVLPGRPPLGGEILSHDFVEAALLRRAGWDIWLACDFDGSYETTPPTLLDHLKRDQRWCQGNLQHIMLLFAQGFRVQSRLHMAFGALSYLSSPLWLILIVLFSVVSLQLADVSPVTYIGRYPVLAWPVSHAAAFVSLFVGTMVLLYAPKFLAIVILLRDREAARQHGGARAIILGVLVETVLSTLLAPILMLSHSWFVANALIGRSIGWGPQQRDSDGIDIGTAVAAFAPHTVVAVAAGVLLWHYLPGSFWWYLPLLAGMAIAIVLGWLTSRRTWGEAARRVGLFIVPSESTGLPILDRVDRLLAEAEPAAQPIEGGRAALREA
jgi:membrane glycosyltransferase